MSLSVPDEEADVWRYYDTMIVGTLRLTQSNATLRAIQLYKRSMHVDGRSTANLSTAGTPSISTSEKPTLRPGIAQDTSRLKVALAEAFVEDPIFSWLMPDADSRPARLRRFFEIELRHLVLPRGRAWTSPELAGAALSLPPGAWHASPRVALLQAGCFGIRLHRAGGILALMEMRHIREPHYYFAYIGVAPAAQGRGLGTTLMSPTLERCDREGLPAYLEASSERNAALYERLGFKVTSELRFAGSPPLRLMIRPPRP